MVATLSDSEIHAKLRPFLLFPTIDCCRWFPIFLININPSVRLRRRPRDVDSVKGDACGGEGELFLVQTEGVFEWIYTQFLGSTTSPQT